MNVQTNNWINVIHSTLHLQPSRFNRGDHFGRVVGQVLNAMKHFDSIR